MHKHSEAFAAASRCKTNTCSGSKEQLACGEFCEEENGCENKCNNNVETDDNDQDYKQSDAEVDDEETIDVID